MHDEYFNHGIIVPDYGNRNIANEVTRYYNVTETDNPYVLHYQEVAIENISTNFKVCQKDIRVEGLTFVVNHYQNNAYDVINNEALNAALTSYKDQLLVDKKRVIEDLHITGDQWFGKHFLNDIGLTLSKDNKIILKRAPKVKTSTTKDKKITKGATNAYFKYCLESYMAQQLGISMRLGVTTKNLYVVINTFKKIFPDITISALSADINCYWGMNGVKEHCEELWNNPKLAKQPKKATKKGKK